MASRFIFVALLLAWASAAPARAEWKAVQVLAPGSVATSADMPMATACTDDGCTLADEKPFADEIDRADDGLPDGEIARAPEGDILAAWYAKPTDRYAHGALGDTIEAGALVVKTADGQELTLDLPDDQVFEDLTPFLADFDGFGKTHIITILSSLDEGSALAIHALKDGALRQVARTPFIGRSNRWLNVAGLEDFDGDGSIQIALVKTPHIGGTLEFWRWSKGELTLSGTAEGFSNHVNGAREQRLSAVEDFDDDGVSDLALPSADRRALRLMAFSGKANGAKTLREIASIPFEAPIDKAIAAHYGDDGVVVTVGLEDGSVWAVSN